jgi:predicted extracellular nuclease/2',3'-cyclic-nucleotide 2'-phosphodiesterase (5'-nucleotidase family)
MPLIGRVSTRRRVATIASAALTAGCLASFLPTAAFAAPDGSGVVINEVYGGGGNSGATYTHDFVELYNPTDADVSLAGLAIEYRSATGGSGGVTPLQGTIPARGHFLVQQAAGSGGTTALPAPDQVGSLNMGGTNGQVLLLPSTTRFSGTGDIAGHAGVIDAVGFGTANSFETAATPALSNSTAAARAADGVDTDSNAADFAVGAPTPQNSGRTGEPEPTPTPTPTPTGPAQAVEISAVQGPGDASPLAGQGVTVEGVVTADYRSAGFNGFYLQDPTPTGEGSDAVFVYGAAARAEIGQSVRVSGVVSEHQGTTEITPAAGGVTVLAESLGTVAPINDWALLDTPAEKEAHEGELILPASTFTVSDNYDANFYGSFVLAHGEGELKTPTEVADADDTAGLAAVRAENDARRITLDDGSTTNFNSTANKSKPLPYLTPENPVRIGSEATFRQPVVLEYRFDAWTFQPTTPVTGDGSETVTFSDERTPNLQPQDVGGDVRLATFNVLNYFPTTVEEYEAAGGSCSTYDDRAGDPVTADDCGDTGPRGAAEAEDLERQEIKIVRAINGLGASIVSLEEIENSEHYGKDRDFAVATLVDALNENAGADVWEYVPSPAERPGASTEDVIRTAFIYKPADVAPVGESVILDHDAFDNARDPLFQAFKGAGAADGEAFLVSVNHFKSKGSGVDDGTGQGNANPDRVAQAQALIDFTAQMQERTGIERVFHVGDFNAYSAEDPVQVIEEAGYTEVNGALNGGEATYSFDGMAGSLDHVFANEAALELVTGVDVWQINAQEQVAFEYSRHNYNATLLYDESVFRASDHNPEIVGLELPEAGDGTTELQILAINDFHGRIQANGEEAGAAVLAGAVAQYEADNPNTLFASAGDNIGASTFTSFIADDNPTIDALSAAGLDVSAVGNHEFDQGFADLTERVIPRYEDRTGLPGADFALGANVYRAGTTEPALAEYAIREVDGVRVGFIGTVTADTETLVSPAGIADLDFGDQLEAANRVAAELTESDAADVIVLLTHSGAETTDCAAIAAEDSEYGELVRGASDDIDAIVSGHTHQLYSCEVGERPVISAHQYGTTLGALDIVVDDETGEPVSVQGSTVDLVAGGTPAFAADPEVGAIVDQAVAEAEELGSVPVGRISADILRGGEPAGSDRGVESSMGNLVADIYLWATSEYENYGGTEDAQIALMNPGGLRDDLRYEGDGTVTYADVAAVQPFGNTLVTVTLTGAQLEQVLEEQWQPGSSRPKLHLGVSDGFTYEYVEDAAAGEHIVSMSYLGEPIAPEDELLIVTNSFLASGGDGFRTFAEGTGTADTGLVDLSATVDYFEAEQVVDPAPLGRAIPSTGEPETPVVEAGEPVIFAERGRIKAGAKLGVDPGEWTEGAQLSYQWLADGEPIRGATDDRFHLTGKYKGQSISVAVTGELTGHDPATAESDPVRTD